MRVDTVRTTDVAISRKSPAVDQAQGLPMSAGVLDLAMTLLFVAVWAMIGQFRLSSGQG